MFERFLHSDSKTGTENTTPSNAPTTSPARPARVEVSQSEPEASQPDEIQQEESAIEGPDASIDPIRTEPMSDSLNPNARPPMAHTPIQETELSSKNENNDAWDVIDQSSDASDEEIDEDNPETALPVDDEPIPPPPAPPSFIKAPKAPVPPAQPTASSSETIAEDPQEEPVEEIEEPQQEDTETQSESAPEEQSEDASENSPLQKEEQEQPHVKIDDKNLRVVRGETLHEIDFADIWYTPEGVAYVRDQDTHFALTPIEANDLEDFHRALEQGFTGGSSYAIRYGGDTYRVERVNTSDGLQYNCRKMPTVTPELETLGFASPIVKHMASLGSAAGLLLFAGPTGQGKTTTASSLMKRFLDKNGGFLYTIEDPPEMPLAGLYHAENGGLGLCKQVPVENDQWGAALRSALRSKPRYILVGEIRTPETASQCLVAATSGHLVISTIHANGVEDALNSMIKYGASTGLAESLVADLLSRGILGVIHQRLEGTTKLRLVYQTAFANPNAQAADQMRMTIRDKNINLSTFMEQQKARMDRGLPMFRE